MKQRNNKEYKLKKTHWIKMGSFRPLTIPPKTHLLGLLAILYDAENVVLTNFEEA